MVQNVLFIIPSKPSYAAVKYNQHNQHNQQKQVCFYVRWEERKVGKIQNDLGIGTKI